MVLVDTVIVWSLCTSNNEQDKLSNILSKSRRIPHIHMVKKKMTTDIIDGGGTQNNKTCIWGTLFLHRIMTSK